ncbi:Clathrin assembly protein AP180 [Handroanthus impetiginosus]|uniref:Clathrin assembly protein AP180 n=1 Tax=Handroanthus impetiginosus TaxID=429701 RepID=A0A2G9HN29_9LAMI|nr:Clathrin assembly protein AP180 [Handroanthus impetiginosus]
MPSKLKKAIAAVKDQTSISLARVSSNTSSNLKVAVLKATSHDDVPVNQKYVDEVLQLVSSNKFHAAACARAIGKRIGRTRNWIVAVKSLMLVLRIFQDGDPYFPREVLHAMKRGSKILNLSSFRDDSNSSPWDFTAFVRTFALYLDERLECFLTGKLQRRYTHGGRQGSIYQRTKSRSGRPNEPVLDMKPAMLLDKISYWQCLLDRAIATRPTGAAKMNRLVQISFYAIVEESFELYKDISDGLTLILDSFFQLQFQNCVNAFQTCVKAAKQFKELSDFYSVCKSIGVGRISEYPSVQTISEELIEALQEFLKDQSSFSSTLKPANRFLSAPSRVNSFKSRQQNISKTAERSSDQPSNETRPKCTSLEDLIKASETGTCPAISIDLEAYSAPQQDDSFRISDTGSTRSLPVTNSMVDLMSLWDWSEQEDKEQLENQQKGSTDSSPVSKNWEIVLVETISSTTSNTTTSFNPNQEPATTPAEENHSTTTYSSASKKWELVLAETLSSTASDTTMSSNPNQEPAATPPLAPEKNCSCRRFLTLEQISEVISSSASDNTTSLKSYQEPAAAPPLMEEKHSTTVNNSTNGWGELILYDPTMAFPQTPFVQQPIPKSTPMLPPNNHYNPFLQDMIEFPATSAPTFQAIPSFSMQNQNQTSFAAQNVDDPFGESSCFGLFSSEPMCSSSMDQQTLLHEQQLWLQNQNKIIAKHMT